MSLALFLAAALSFGAAALASDRPAARQVNLSLSDSDRLKELDMAIRAAHARGEIDRAAADSLHVDVGRTRRQMFRMGIQVGYRQRVRLRQRIDRLYARLAQGRTSGRR